MGIYQHSVKQFQHPFTFEGSTNSDVVETYFDKLVFPNVEKGSVIILDNAAFHRKSILKDLSESYGCRVLFLPTYSPDLNPIEKCWANIKKITKKLKRESEMKTREVIEIAINMFCQLNAI